MVILNSSVSNGWVKYVAQFICVFVIILKSSSDDLSVFLNLSSLRDDKGDC